LTQQATEPASDRGDASGSIRGAIERLTAELQARNAALKALRDLAGAGVLEDLEKFRKALSKALPKLGAPGLGLEDLRQELEVHAQRVAAEQRRRFGRELRELCEAAGLGLRVVRAEEPIEVRIAPLSVTVDYNKGRARLSFSRELLAECPAQAGEVLKAYRATLKELETPFDPAAFFETCWTAYRSTLAAQGKRMTERVELLDFLPRLALEQQGKKFRVDPRREHFQDYPRARFAYDVLRLRRAAALEQGGRRIQFGVATGTSATQKDRVLYLEDEEGRGEYKLTVFFRVEEKS
jgi:hypothetical protein